MTLSTSILGGSLYVVANLFYSGGSFIADFNHTHVLNPRWPPHAKFHNGQTMSLGVVLALFSSYLALKPAQTTTEKVQNLWTAAVVGSLYCSAGISAILYPGSDWVDPEFAVPIKGVQGYGFAVQVVVIWLAYTIETRALAKSKTV